MDLSKMSVGDLRALEQQVRQEIQERQHEEMAHAREQILAIAQRVGVPLEELLKGSGAVKGSKVAKLKAKVAVRFRHPSDLSIEWTGRGRQPQWIKDWVASGQSMDALRI